MKNNSQFGSIQETIFYPVLVLVIMWLVFWADHLFPDIPFYQYGVLPHDWSKWYGIIGMPWIHSKNDIEHIVNNSFPVVVLLAALIYYYRAVALRVFLLLWLITGLGVWVFAVNSHSYHIGMSGVIYGLVGFLFVSGVLRKYKPLQAISLFVVFVYGSMIWGIFPMKAHVSWEGHLSGLIGGVFLAFLYKEIGPKAPKLQYEVEKEMGIEPPDLEGIYNEKVRLMAEREKLEEEKRLEMLNRFKVVYHYKPKEES